jgi:hypothetical protein
MSASRKSNTRSLGRPTPPPLSPLPEHVFTPEFLAYLAERDEPVTAAEADFNVPWHIELFPKDPRGRWAVLRLGQSFEKSTLTQPAAVFDRKEDALLACAILPGLGKRLRFRLASDPEDLGYPLLDDGQIVGHSEHFHEDFVAALNVAAALVAAPREFAFLLDAMGGLALEHVDRIAVARLEDPAG